MKRGSLLPLLLTLVLVFQNQPSPVTAVTADLTENTWNDMNWYSNTTLVLQRGPDGDDDDDNSGGLTFAIATEFLVPFGESGNLTFGTSENGPAVMSASVLDSETFTSVTISVWATRDLAFINANTVYVRWVPDTPSASLGAVRVIWSAPKSTHLVTLGTLEYPSFGIPVCADHWVVIFEFEDEAVHDLELYSDYLEDLTSLFETYRPIYTTLETDGEWFLEESSAPILDYDSDYVYWERVVSAGLVFDSPVQTQYRDCRSVVQVDVEVYAQWYPSFFAVVAMVAAVALCALTCISCVFYCGSGKVTLPEASPPMPPAYDGPGQPLVPQIEE